MALTPPITVALDALSLRGTMAGTGVGRYVLGLLGGLAALPDVTVHALATDDAELPTKVRRLRARRWFGTGRPEFMENMARREVEARLVRADVFHNPAPDPLRFPPHPNVQTLHDLIPLTDDDPALDVMRKRFRRYGSRYTSADAVVAVSRYAAETGIERYGLDPARVHVVHHGVDAGFSPDGPTRESETPYVLVVSEFSPRKGFDAAFDVVAALADAGHPHHLAVAGRVPPWQRQALDRLLAEARRRDRVELLGFVDDLAALYRGAALCLVTSRHEGFGFSAVEAMACGTPVVAFANTAIPEVVSGAGVLVPDGDVPAMAEAAARLIESDGDRAAMRRRGLERAAELTWAASAAAHLRVYRSVLAS